MNRYRRLYCLLIFLLLLLGILVFSLFYTAVNSQRNRILNTTNVGTTTIENAGNAGIGSYKGELDFIEVCNSNSIFVLPDSNNNLIANLIDIPNVAGTFGPLEIQVNNQGQVVTVSNVSYSVLQSLNGASPLMAIIEAGTNINVTGLIISTNGAIVVENLTVTGMTQLGLNTSCAAPLPSSCVDISGSSCSAPFMPSCIPKNLQANTVVVENLMIDNGELDAQLSDLTNLNVDLLYVNQLNFSGSSSSCSERIDQDCITLDLQSCTSPIQSSCILKDQLLTDLQIRQLGRVNQVSCPGGPIDSSCLNINGFTCPSSPIDDSCFENIIKGINGINGTELVLTGLIETGEPNTGLNVGSDGQGPFKQKMDENLQFYSVGGPFVTQVNDQIRVDFTPSGVVPGIYVIPTITVDSLGRIVSAVDSGFQILDASNVGATGSDIFKQKVGNTLEFRTVDSDYLEIIADTLNNNVLIDLPDTTVIPGTYANQDNVPVVTVDEKGFLTNVNMTQVKRSMGTCTFSAVGINSGSTFNNVYTNTCGNNTFDGTRLTVPLAGFYSINVHCKSSWVGFPRVVIVINSVAETISYDAGQTGTTCAFIVKELVQGDTVGISATVATQSRCYIEVTSLF